MSPGLSSISSNPSSQKSFIFDDNESTDHSNSDGASTYDDTGLKAT